VGCGAKGRVEEGGYVDTYGLVPERRELSPRRFWISAMFVLLSERACG